MKGKPMERMDYDPLADKEREKTVVKEKIIILKEGEVTPEIALKVLKKANGEFACEREIPWKLAERIFYKKRLIRSKPEFNSILEYLEALGKIKVIEIFDPNMQMAKVIKLTKGDT